MKKSIFRIMMLASAGLVLATSCKKEGCTDPAANNYDEKAKKDDGSCTYTVTNWYTEVTYNGETYRQLPSHITSNQTLTADAKWMLSGGTFVDNGVTLTIEAGTTVYAANDGTVPFLSISQGGKINAVGTSSAPIIFTPVKESPAPGDWGGIVINGYAPLNNGTTAEGEGGTGTYGGTNAADNSGTMKYVRVEFAGKILGTDNELNGFSFNGVGSGTTLEYLQAYRGSDDGFEFFGGTASLKYAVSTGNQDDSFDFTNGWVGNGQFWIVQQNTDGGDRGIEGDNNESDNTAMPYTNPTISNVTLVGVDDGDVLNQGLKLRQGMKGNFYNVVVTGFPKRGCQVEHNVSIANMDAQSLNFKNSIIDNVSPFKFTASTGNDTIPAANPTHIFSDAAYNNSTATDGSLVTFLSGYVGTTAAGAMDPTTLGSWFSAGTYIGAVSSSSNWTTGWVRAL